MRGLSRASLHLVRARDSGEAKIWLALVTLLSVARNSDTTFPQIPHLIYHQSDERIHNDGTTYLFTTNQTTLVVQKERKYLKPDTFAEVSW